MREHKKSRQPAQKEGEVVAVGGEYGIAAVAVALLEIIAAHAVLGLDMADDRLDRGAPPHLTADRGGDATGLARDPHPELLLVIGTRPVMLSITHNSGKRGAELDVGESRETAPHHDIAGWWIVGSGEITAQPGNFSEVL